MQINRQTIAALGLGLLALNAQASPTQGTSYTPIVGYDDKNGALYGAAAFFYEEGRPGYNTGVYGVSNGKDFHSMTFSMEQRSQAGLDLSLSSNVARTFDNYYGEGNGTSDQDALRVAQDRVETSASALVHVDEKWAVGPSLGLKARKESGVALLKEGTVLEQRAFPDSANPAVGLRAVYDDRDSTLSSQNGGMWAFDVKALPSKIAFLNGAKDAWQAQAEWRQFQKLGAGLVLAHRLEGGASLGQPGYAERYSLGGTTLLRGFEDNRFRGKQFYCMQEELRVPVWKAVSAAASVDLGDVGDGALGRPRRSFQAGIRAGLPPSYGMKARLDFGYGDTGERSMALQFGETF
jgi:outer membrane protein assembly factor BamA